MLNDIMDQRKDKNVDKKIYLKTTEDRLNFFSDPKISNWQPTKVLDKKKDPYFLIGFPRSGTTLLDTILRSHPEIDVLEEKDPLQIAEMTAVNKLNKQISDFHLLNQEELNALRTVYYTRIQFHSNKTGKIIVDKLPLNTIKVPLIKLLFPKAKFIFALRHPCDSILSCLQQSFKPNTSMANFTTLERSVDYYDKVMNGWMIYNDCLELDCVVSRYEDLVANFDENISKILLHLNLDWDDNLKNYRRTALNRSFINTPSSSQVVQPIYNTSIGRWRNYGKYFAKHMDRLRSWIEYFDYSED